MWACGCVCVCRLLMVIIDWENCFLRVASATKEHSLVASEMGDNAVTAAADLGVLSLTL